MQAPLDRGLAPTRRSSGRRMARATPAGHAGRVAWEGWTWELPAGDEEGLEGYRVTDVWDRPVGSVRVLLRRGDDLYLVVRSRSPYNAAHKPIPLECVAFADHGRCVVGLSLSREQFARWPPLSHRDARKGDADATRVIAVPPLLDVTRAPAQAATASPFLSAFLLSAIGLLSLLAVILFVTAPWDAWEVSLFGIPLVFFLLALAVTYRGTNPVGRTN